MTRQLQSRNVWSGIKKKVWWSCLHDCGSLYTGSKMADVVPVSSETRPKLMSQTRNNGVSWSDPKHPSVSVRWGPKRNKTAPFGFVSAETMHFVPIGNWDLEHGRQHQKFSPFYYLGIDEATARAWINKNQHCFCWWKNPVTFIACRVAVPWIALRG